MSTSLDSPASGSISKSEFLSSLPRWRRFLARLNWHPVVEYEIREIERERWLQQLRIEELQRETAHEQRMQQLAKEDERLRKEDEQLRKENEQLRKEDERLRKEDERLAELDRRMSELDAKIAALWPSSTSSSHQAPPPERDSPT